MTEDDKLPETAAAASPVDDTTIIDGTPTRAADPLAWSIDDPGVNDPDHRGVSWRPVAVIGAVIVAAAAVVAGSIIAWGHHQPAPASAPPTAAKPAPAPAVKPPAWQPNGTYRMELRNPEGTMRDGATGAVEPMSDLGVSTATSWEAWKTECTPTNCTARTIALDDVTHQHADGTATLFRWNGTEWESTGGVGPHGGNTGPVECVTGPGVSTYERWATMSPLPDGSFRGTFHRTVVKSGCGGLVNLGDQQDVPMVVVRIRDTPQGVFR